MEAGPGLVAGSQTCFVVINSDEFIRDKPLLKLDEQICRICGDEIELIASKEGEKELFVACNECAYPVCRPCYEYERKEGSQCCPQCKTRYRRHPGSVRVDGDEEEDGADDLVKEFDLDRYNDKYSDTDTYSEIRYCSTNIEEAAEGTDCAIVTLHSTPFERLGQSTPPSKLWDHKRDNWRLQMLQQKNSIPEKSTDFPMTVEARQPLSRKLSIPSKKINPFRMLIVLRIMILGFYFHYRLLNPVSDAYVLWMISIICEFWFSFTWILRQLPKWNPIMRETYIDRLLLRHGYEEEFLTLADVDVFVTTVDPEKEPPLITANTVLSIISVDYPAEKLSCYVSDDGASMLTFEVLSETCEFSKKWVPFCKRFNIEPRAPERYFAQKVDYLKGKVDAAFVTKRLSDEGKMHCMILSKDYEEFKVYINQLVYKAQKNPGEDWSMQDGSPWPGNNLYNHPGMVQVLLGGSNAEDEEGIKLPRLIYISREKRPGFDHHNKAGAMNSLVRASAILSNAPYILNVDCDQYINNCKALYEAMCFMMDPRSGNKVGYIQFPQRFEGTENDDMFSNRNAVFFDIDMKGLDGIQGPICVGSGCVFRRQALYGFEAPLVKKPVSRTCNCWPTWCCFCCGFRTKNRRVTQQKHNTKLKKVNNKLKTIPEESQELLGEESPRLPKNKLEKKFGHSLVFIDSTFLKKGGVVHDGNLERCISEALHVISCSYENKTDWGKEVGWTYGSVTEDILTGFKLHCHGWRSVYCVSRRPAFKGSSPVNLQDHLYQALRRALGSVQIFLSRHCPIWYGYRGGLKCLQRIFYINSVIYPWASIFLIAYCTLPAFCLLTGSFIIPEISYYASTVYTTLFVSTTAGAILEMRWGYVGMVDWWRNEQFLVISSSSSHLFALFHGILKFTAGIEPDSAITSQQSSRWPAMFVPPLTLLSINVIAIVIGIGDYISNGLGSWELLMAKLLFAFWVVVHLYPFLRGLMGKKNRVPTIIVVWSILLGSVFSLLWLRMNPFTAKFEGPALEVCGLDCDINR